MRLLEHQPDGNLIFRQFNDKDAPAYAILSHTWLADNNEEVTLEDLEAGLGEKKAGWDKIAFCANKAAADGLLYSWVDTCCIKKSSSAELSESLNSMFRWYYRAEKCYVYLSDVGDDTDNTWGAGFSEQQMAHSRLDASRIARSQFS